MESNKDNIGKESTSEESGRVLLHESQSSHISESHFLDDDIKEDIPSQLEKGKDNLSLEKSENKRKNSKLTASSVVQTSKESASESTQSFRRNRSGLTNKNIDRDQCIQDGMRKNINLMRELEPPVSNSAPANFDERLFEESQDINYTQSKEKFTESTQVIVYNKLEIAIEEKHTDLAEVNEPSTYQEDRNLHSDNENHSLSIRMSSVTLSELSIDCTDYFDPIFWDIKFASNIVDFVVRFYYRQYGLFPRWNHANYDSLPENLYTMFRMDDADQVQSVLLYNRQLYEAIFYSLIDPNMPVDQSVFDNAVNVVLHESLYHYCVPMKAFQFATTIAVFGIISSQMGFSDALYHAVYSIFTNVRILRTCFQCPSNNLLMMFPGNMLTTYGYESVPHSFFLPRIV